MARLHGLSHFVDGALFIAVMTQMLSLADLILSEKQKESFESWCDEIARKLALVNTGEFLQRWYRTSRRAAIGEILFIILAALGVLGPTIWEAYSDFRNGFEWINVLTVFLVFIFQCIAWSWAAKTYYFVAPAIFEDLNDKPTLKDFIKTYVLIAIIGLFAVIIGGAIIFWALSITGDHGLFHTGVRIIVNYYVGLVLAWIVIFFDGLITLSVAILTFPFRAVVVSVRWFMGRVSAYKKGPLAALNLVATAVLAMMHFWVTGS